MGRQPVQLQLVPNLGHNPSLSLVNSMTHLLTPG